MPELLDCTPEIQAILHTAINQATDNRLRAHILLQSLAYRHYLARMDPILDRKAGHLLALYEKDIFKMDAAALERHRKAISRLEEDVMIMDAMRTALDEIDRLYRAQQAQWARFVLDRRKEYEDVAKAYTNLVHAQKSDLEVLEYFVQAAIQQQKTINQLTAQLANYVRKSD